MKKTLLSVSILSVLLFFSCYDFTNIETPEKLSVSTNATYEFPAGQLKYDLCNSDDFGAKKFNKILSDNISSDESESGSVSDKAKASTQSLHVYDYNPGGKEDGLVQYILHYPIKEIPLSLTDSIGADDASIADLSFSKDFTIPDFTQNIKDALTFNGAEFKIIETGSYYQQSIKDALDTMNIEHPYVYFSITQPDFKNMIMRSGSIRVTFTPKDCTPSPDFYMTVSLMLVEDGKNPYNDPSSIIAQSNDVNCAQGGVIELPLAGAALTKKMNLYVDGYIYGGSSGTWNNETMTFDTKINTYTISFAAESLSIAKVTGLNMDFGDDAKIDIDETVPFENENETLKEASLKSGSMSISCVLPDGWSGVTCKESSFSLTGGINLPDDKFTDKTAGNDFLRREADLAGFKITQDDIHTSGNLEISIKDATLVFNENGNTIKLDGALKIDEIDKVKLDLSKIDFETDQEPIDTGLNLNELISNMFSDDGKGDKNQSADLIRNIEFPDISTYLYVTQSADNNIFGGITVKGRVKALYDYTENNEKKNGEKYLVGEGEAEELGIRTCTKSMKEYADENDIITDDAMFKEHDNPKDNLYSFAINSNDMTEIINANPESLKIDYKIGITGNTDIELTNEDILNFKNKGGLSISIAIIFPLSITFVDKTDGTDDGKITIDDLMSLTGNTNSNDDILGRKSKDFEKNSDSDTAKYSKLIQSVGMKYNFRLPTGFGITITVEDENLDIKKELSTSSGEHRIEFSADDVDKIKDNPFNPKFSLAIDAGKVEFKRNEALTFSAILDVKTSGEFVEVWTKD